MREQRVFADGREWLVNWESGYWNEGRCDFPVIEIVSVHATNDETFEVEAEVTDEIEGTKRQQKIYQALEVALKKEAEQ